MSDTKDLQYFKDEFARNHDSKNWASMRSDIDKATESIIDQVIELYAAHLQEQAFDEGCEAQKIACAQHAKGTLKDYPADKLSILNSPNARNPYKTQSNEPEN